MRSEHGIAGTRHQILEHPATAANATAKFYALYVPFAIKLSSIAIIPSVAITHHDSNFPTITVMNGTDELGDVSFSSAYENVAEDEPYVIDCADVELAAGDVVTLEITQTNAGMAFPLFLSDAMFVGA